MKSTIAYLHGFDSSPATPTAKKVKDAFPHENFECPHIDHRDDPDKIKDQMDKFAHHLHKKGDSVVVGSSAGGFWGDYLAAKHGIKSVLVNPSLHPSKNFRKYNLPEEHYKKYEKIEKEIKNHPRHTAVAFHGTEDKVVPLEHVQTHYKHPIMLHGEGHQLKDFTPVTDMAHKMVGNFPEHTE